MIKNIGTAGFNVGTNKVGSAVKKIPFSKMFLAGKIVKEKIKSKKI